MTNSTSPSGDPGDYASSQWVESQSQPGIRFQIARLSLGRRVALTRSVRALWQRLEYHGAGQAVDDSLTQAVLSAELDAEYLRWGLVAIEGLSIDGNPASIPTLIESGPEKLCQEIIAAIKREIGLNEDERKN